jgi:hypothetical protein
MLRCFPQPLTREEEPAVARTVNAARIVNSALVGTAAVALTDSQRKSAQRRLARRQARNPLRRVRLGCCASWVLDPSAVVGDWLWCDSDDDLGRIVEVVE